MKLHRPRAAWAAIGLLVATGVLIAAPALATKVTFRYQPVIGGVSAVSVAGSFNTWNATDHPLKDPAKTGIWSADYDLPPGKITYKFVVNGDQWLPDDNAAETEADGFGGLNSVLVIGNEPLVVGYGTTVKKAPPPAKMGLRRVPFKFKPDKPTTEAISLAGSLGSGGRGGCLRAWFSRPTAR